MNSDTRGPNEELGDQSGSRSGGGYSFQAACIAGISLDLEDPPTDYAIVYCEHQDDIMVERIDGSFIGIQVKTLGNTRNKLKTSEGDVIQSFQNFVMLDNKYQNRFSEFQLIINSSYWRSPGSGDDLHYSLEHYVKSPDPPIPTRGVFRNLMDSLITDNLDYDAVLSTLRKVRLREFPNFKSIESAIAIKLSKKFRIGTRGFDAINKVALQLIMEMDAKCSVHKDYLRKYHEIFGGLEQELDQAVIEAKKVTIHTIHQIVKQNLGSSITLRHRDPSKSLSAPSGLDSLEKKLLRGGIEIDHIDHLLNCKYNAWQVFHEFILEDDKEMIDNYQSAKVIVREHCLASQGKTETTEGEYGMMMLKELRQRISDRKIIDIADSEKENILVLGIAGILTEDCEVWWSEKFDLEEYI